MPITKMQDRIPEIDLDNNSIAHAHLRELILQQIDTEEKRRESQDRNTKLFKRILHRISIIHISLCVLILLGVIILIYIVSQPESKTNTVLKEIESLNSRITIQRVAVDIDKQRIKEDSIHLENIRSQVKNIAKSQDSIKNSKK